MEKKKRKRKRKKRRGKRIPWKKERRRRRKEETSEGRLPDFSIPERRDARETKSRANLLTPITGG